MLLFYFSIGLAIVATVFYHLIQKLTPAGANPALSLVLTYLVAALLSLALFPFYPLKDGLAAGLRQLNWTSIGLGAVIVGLEIGFLLAYRAGWNVSVAAVAANVAVAVVLIPIGLLFFKERVSPINLLGLILCIAGLVMVNRK
jgi:uncharacterized membrane protein